MGSNPAEGHWLTTMRKLLETGEFSDVIVTCRGRVWKCHRAILGPASKHFYELFASNPRGPDNLVLQLDGMNIETEIVAYILHHIYGEDVTAQIIGRETEDTLPATLVKLLSAAVRFQLVRLQAKIHTTLSRYLDEKALLAFRKFEDPLQRRWLDGLFEAVRTAVKLPGCKGAEASLQAFFWVTRHETVRLPAVEAFLLEEWGRFSSDLMLLFTDGQCPRVPPWFQGQSCQVDDIELAVRRFEGLRKSQAEILVCSSCGRADIPANERAYNHFPFIEKDCGVVVGIGERIWCKQCVERMLAGTNGVGVPWRRL